MVREFHREQPEIRMDSIPDASARSRATKSRSGGGSAVTPAMPGRKCYRLVVMSFGLLCILQATLNISLRLLLYNKTVNMEASLKTVTEERDQLKRKLNDTDKKVVTIEASLKAVTEERDQLKRKLNETELSCCVSSQRCPAGWREINSRCYFLSSESKTWEESRKYCQSKDADLVVINSRQEQAALYRLNGEAVFLFWIGLYNMDGTFRWVDRSTLTETFWQAGQPNLGDPTNREDCVEMYHLEPQFANWNNVPCEKVQRWLCEREKHVPVNIILPV